jgi:hypothetical protein
VKKLGWGVVFVFMVLLVWNTRVTVPGSAEAIVFDVCALCLIVLTFLAGRTLWFALFPKTRTAEPEAEDESRLTFDLADEHMNSNSGWDRVHVYAKNMTAHGAGVGRRATTKSSSTPFRRRWCINDWSRR